MEPDEITLETVSSKVDQCYAILIELVEWKNEVNEAVNEMKGSGMLGIISKMFGAKT